MPENKHESIASQLIWKYTQKRDKLLNKIDKINKKLEKITNKYLDVLLKDGS